MPNTIHAPDAAIDRLDLYRQMLRIRVVEETIAEHYAEQEMRCPVHLSIGQEAAEAGACAALQQRDCVLSGHRSHGHYLAKGGNLNAMVAEIYGKATGCAGGKGGSMHLVDRDAGFLGSAPIVGSTIPIAVGVALAAQMRKEDRVVMVFLGDGATETGAFYESINFAALKNLPIVFLVENNLYSVYSPMSVRQHGDARITDIARAHGMPAQHADGNDLDLVYQTSLEAVHRARQGRGPSLLEFSTYRWREHCGPGFDNDIGYRSEAEFLHWKACDPVRRYEQKLLELGLSTPETFAQMAKALRAQAEAAIAFAKDSPWPDLACAVRGVYAN
jgi:pyruvate dehydrogenase E1 component alpha subunit